MLRIRTSSALPVRPPPQPDKGTEWDVSDQGMPEVSVGIKSVLVVPAAPRDENKTCCRQLTNNICYAPICEFERHGDLSSCGVWMSCNEKKRQSVAGH